MYLRRSYFSHFLNCLSVFCPGGHLSAGFVFGIPFAWPCGSLPPPFVCVILANDGAEVTVSATTNMAASVSITMMRFMHYLLSLPHLPNGVPLKRCRVGCEFAGAGRLVCASTFSYKQASCPLPFRFLCRYNLGQPPPFPSDQNKTGH